MSIQLIGSDGKPVTQAVGNVAHDAADSGNPIKMGGKALSALPTAVTVNDRVNAFYDLFGIQQVALRDSAGAAIAVGVQYVEDAALAANAGQGTLVIARRDDALSTLTPAQDDAVGLRVGDKGALWVQISDGSGNQITSFGGGTQYVGDAAATATPTGTIAMGLANAAAPTDVNANNDAVAAWYLRNGAQVSVLSAAGALIGGDAANGLDVDVTRVSGTVTIAGAVTNAGTFAVQDSEKVADNAAFTDGTTKVQPVGFIFDEVAGTALTENDIGAARMNVNRAMVGVIEDGATRARYATVSAANALKVDGSAVTQPVSGTFWQATQPVSGTITINAIPAGGNNIGDVDVLTVPADPFGANADAVVAAGAAGSISAKLRRATQGLEDLKTGIILAAGSAAIGKLAANSGVDIGDVDVLTMPADPFGTNADAAVAAGASGSQSAKLRRLTQGVEDLKTTIVLAAGSAAIGKLATNTGVNIGQVDVVSILPGAGATSLGKTEDAAHTTGDVGVMALAVRNDAGTVLAGTTLDYIPLTTDATGALRVVGTSVLAGDVAHDTADSGNPIKMGGYASGGAPANVTAGDRANFWLALNGAAVVSLGQGLMTAADGVAKTQQAIIGTSSGSGTGALLPVIGYMDNGTTLDVLKGTAANGLDVDVTRLPALVAGSANIGDVDVLTVPAPLSTTGNGTAAAALRVTLASDSTGIVAITGSVDTELPAAAALADGAGNPTTPTVGAAGLVWSGSVWDRLKAVNVLSDADGAGIPAAGNTVFNSGVGWERMRSIRQLDAAPNVDTGVLAVGNGPGWDRKTNPTGVAATSTANAVTVVVDGADTISFHVTTIGTTPGSMIFETTTDDGAWATAGAVIKLGSLETWVEGSFVPAVNDIYLVRTTGIRQVRYRVNAVYASGTATVKVTGSSGVGIVKSVEMAPAPHKIGYTQVGVSAQYTTTQTSVTIGPTVSSSQRMVVYYMQIQAGGTTAGEIQVYFGTGAYSRGTNKPIFDGEFAPSATSKPGVLATSSVPFVGAADEELKVTTSAAINKLTVTIWYYLIAA